MKRKYVYGKRNRDEYGWLHGVGLGHFQKASQINQEPERKKV
jgi:hypothetical protein